MLDRKIAEIQQRLDAQVLPEIEEICIQINRLGDTLPKDLAQPLARSFSQAIKKLMGPHKRLTALFIPEVDAIKVDTNLTRRLRIGAGAAWEGYDVYVDNVLTAFARLTFNKVDVFLLTVAGNISSKRANHIKVTGHARSPKQITSVLANAKVGKWPIFRKHLLQHVQYLKEKRGLK